MKTSELLQRLSALGVRLWVEGAELKVHAPKGALTPELKQELLGHKQALLQLLASARQADELPIPRWRDGRASPDEPRPMSFTQKRVWFLDQLEPGLIAYNMWIALSLHGPLDVPAFERSLREVVRRHEVLRSSFPAQDGVPAQHLHPPERIRLELLERPTDLSEARWRERVRALLNERIGFSFDLVRDPLFQPALVRLAEDEHVFFARIHHIVYDGLSTGVLARELGQIYVAFTRGQPSPLPEPALQYHDYAAWQAQRFDDEHLERELVWWRRTLAGPLPVLELPADRPRPSVQTHAGANHTHRLDERLARELDACARREGTTVFAVMLAAYDAFLARLTGESDVLVGTAAANRGRAELGGLIGYFVNTLVLRTDASGDPPFRELVARVEQSFLGAMEHQEIPFERLVDDLSPRRSLSHSPLFQTLFVLNQDTGEERTLGGLRAIPYTLGISMSRNDLVVTVYRGRDETTIDLEYNTALFDPDRIARFGCWYERLLADAVRDPRRRLSELELLDREERELVLEGWNRTRAQVSPSTMHGLFEASADARPDSLALCVPSPDGAEHDEHWSYAELEAWANRIAHHLRARGVRPRELVGLCCERSADLVAGLLAIQKCGAAYVPLDPGFPRERLVYMVEDARLCHVVTQAALRALLPDRLDAVLLDDERAAIAARPSVRPAPSATLDDRAYVIYTSGSTGKPKGVELMHRGVASFLASMRREPGMRAGESLLALTTLSFDISVLELFLPLSSGGTVILTPREIAGDGERLRALFERLQPQLVQATPATWRMLLLAGWRGAPELRVLCGGEALPRELADELCERSGELWNLYGPTETTIWSTVRRIERDGRPITIGRPIANTRVYVLDAEQQPVPPGVTGELWIAGDGLARGYLGRPRLTAERFVPDPFQPQGGQRMYRTGDLARWRLAADGSGELECLGRIDQQVKLRGFRIELGEVESVLCEVEGVRECVAIVREDTPGDQRLVAYFTRAPAAQAVEVGALRAAARAHLPAYMVPALYQELEALPLTPNGKVDRKALHALESQAPALEREHVPPRNATEETIARVWSQVLGLEAVTVDTNFFDLGGHSLLLAQVHARLLEHFPGIGILELFQFPTVSALAEHLSGGARDTAEDRDERKKGLAAGREALLQRRRVRR